MHVWENKREKESKKNTNTGRPTRKRYFTGLKQARKNFHINSYYLMTNTFG